MTRISGEIWQGSGAVVLQVAVGLLGGWWWHANGEPLVGAQESTPFAGTG